MDLDGTIIAKTVATKWENIGDLFHLELKTLLIKNCCCYLRFTI